MNETRSWAADPLREDAITAVDAMERAVTVDLIATFEPKLVCCAPTDKLDDLVTSSNHRPFDYLPVRTDDRIVGLLPLHEFRNSKTAPAAETAEGAM
jgi:hypothetical protein